MKIVEMFDVILFITQEDEFKVNYPECVIELKGILQDKSKNINMMLANEVK